MERRRLRRWLEEGVEDRETVRVFVQVRRNLDRLVGDVELLVLVCRGLRGEGRLAGRGRLPRGFGRRSPSGG
jgi:hypothetical protein